MRPPEGGREIFLRQKSRRLRCDSLVLLLVLDERLQTVQEICGALRMGGGGEDRPFIARWLFSAARNKAKFRKILMFQQ